MKAFRGRMFLQITKEILQHRLPFLESGYHQAPQHTRSLMSSPTTPGSSSHNKNLDPCCSPALYPQLQRAEAAQFMMQFWITSPAML
jgi:hypothetical protein